MTIKLKEQIKNSLFKLNINNKFNNNIVSIKKTYKFSYIQENLLNKKKKKDLLTIKENKSVNNKYLSTSDLNALLLTYKSNNKLKSNHINNLIPEESKSILNSKNKIFSNIIYNRISNLSKKKKNKKIIKYSSLISVSRNIKKRKNSSSSIYHIPIVDKFINYLMKNGKKSTAENIFYKTLIHIYKKTHKRPQEILEKAIANALPVIEVKPRRLRGRTLQVPRPMTLLRRYFLAIKWIIKASKGCKENNFIKKLALELITTANNKSRAVFKKKELHKIAKSNIVYMRFPRKNKNTKKKKSPYKIKVL